jgi:hypothetical protein
MQKSENVVKESTRLDNKVFFGFANLLQQFFGFFPCRNVIRKVPSLGLGVPSVTIKVVSKQRRRISGQIDVPLILGNHQGLGPILLDEDFIIVVRDFRGDALENGLTKRPNVVYLRTVSFMQFVSRKQGHLRDIYGGSCRSEYRARCRAWFRRVQ